MKSFNEWREQDESNILSHPEVRKLLNVERENAKRLVLESIAARVKRDVEFLEEMAPDTDPKFIISVAKGIILNLRNSGVKV